MITPIPALYYAGMVQNSLLTANLVVIWLSNKNTCQLLIPVAYTHTETRLVLAGITKHQHKLNIDGSSTNCISSIHSYN